MNPTAFTALTLKLFGIIFVLIGLLDFLTLLIPVQMDDPQWQLATMTGIVDRGVAPLLGMGLLTMGYWLDGREPGAGTKGTGLDLRLPIYGLAIALGLVFLLLIPLHLTNVNQIKNNAVGQLDARLGQEQQQMEMMLRRLDALSQNPEMLDQQIQQGEQILAAGQINGNQLNQEQLTAVEQELNQLKGLREMGKDPQALQARMDEIKANLQEQVQEQRQKVEQQAAGQALKQGLRVGLTSLMLAIGFAAFGALGLRGVLSAPTVPPSGDGPTV